MGKPCATTVRTRTPWLSFTLAVTLIPPLLWAQGRPAGNGGSRETKYEGRTIEEWVAQLSKGFQEYSEAEKALARIGKPAVPVLAACIRERQAGTGRAIQALCKMGPAAAEALPLLLKIARDPTWKPPEGWTWNVSPRELTVSHLKDLSWASDELIPVLREMARNDEEPEGIRTRATRSLGGMGEKAVPVLTDLARSKHDELRKTAHFTLAALSSDGAKDYFARVLEENPHDVNAAEYLGRTKGRYNLGRLDPLTERVKTAMRERLNRSRDPQLAWALAAIIQDQLSGTSIQWAAPSDSYSMRTDRENPKESFSTLSEVAEIGFRHAKRKSALWRRFGIGLAKMHLLRGDWSSMNDALEKLGQEPVDPADRPFLHAPPDDWEKGLRSQWRLADEKMRSGDCGLVLRIEKDGGGLAGVHVLVKEAPEPVNVFHTGWKADTLFFSETPFERHIGSFGYKGADRSMTRYAVSDRSGVVRFEKLPAMKVQLEVLVPTANFAEAAPSWELWMDVGSGKFQLASRKPGPNTVNSSSPPAIVELEKGKTVEYPLLVVRPKFGFNIHDGARADPRAFVLSWPSVKSPSGSGLVSYELEMNLTAIQSRSRINPPVLRTTSVTVKETRRDVGRRGVGGMRLKPGNLYAFRLTARDQRGGVIARTPLVTVWVPWTHRKSDPPILGRSPSDSVPISHGAWWRSSSSTAGGRSENLRQRVEGFLRQRPRAFEVEYLQMGEAWLDWRDGKPTKARARLARLVSRLPEGNVARATSSGLIELIDKGAKGPKRLNFLPGDG
ncbi:MAG: HEAT repeat domain-containing protein [Planctomycetota bacterium]|nr:HEAT repeat domain-containing protein [Planctomycetota bacterium]